MEMLRIGAIMLISLMHGIKSAYGSPNALNDIAHFAINAVGNMGVTVFVLLSGFYSIHFRLPKLIKLWLTVLSYSLIIFGVDLWLSETPLTTKEFIKGLYTALTPITSGTWWFISSYFIVFLLSPLLNLAAEKMKKQQFQYLLVVLLLIYSLSPTFLLHPMSDNLYGKCTENMILAYLIGRYLALHGIPDILTRRAGWIFVGCTTFIFCFNYMMSSPFFMSKDNNLFIIIGATSLFILFRKMNTDWGIFNSIVLKGATYAFPLYLLNWWLIGLIEPTYAPLANENLFLIYFFVSQLAIILITIITESLRRLLLDYPTNLLGNYVDRKFSGALSNILTS